MPLPTFYVPQLAFTPAPASTEPADGAIRAANLDRLADHELRQGRHYQAERLALLAAGLRELAQ